VLVLWTCTSMTGGRAGDWPAAVDPSSPTITTGPTIRTWPPRVTS